MITFIIFAATMANLYFVLTKRWYAKDPYMGVVVSTVVTVIALINLIRLVVT